MTWTRSPAVSALQMLGALGAMLCPVAGEHGSCFEFREFSRQVDGETCGKMGIIENH